MKYFGYGSNINLEQMRQRLGNLGKVYPGEPYILKNWKLTFDAGSIHTRNTFANIYFEKGAEVEGLIYDLNINQFNRLSMYEVLYNRRYFIMNGDKVYTFIAMNANRVSMVDRKPFLFYLNTIIDGCLEAKLEKTYKKLLEYKKQNYKLKRGNKHK